MQACMQSHLLQNLAREVAAVPLVVHTWRANFGDMTEVPNFVDGLPRALDKYIACTVRRMVGGHIPGLMSRCTRSCACMAASPVATCSVMAHSSCSEKYSPVRRLSAIWSARLPPALLGCGGRWQNTFTNN